MNHEEFNLLFGKYIRFAREEKGFSREELSSRTDLDRSTIERIEYGKSDPKYSTVFILEEVLDINISDINREIRKQLIKHKLD